MAAVAAAIAAALAFAAGESVQWALSLIAGAIFTFALLLSFRNI